MEHPQSSKQSQHTRLGIMPESAPLPTVATENADLVTSAQAELPREPHIPQFSETIQSSRRRRPFEKQPWYLITGPLGSGKSTALRHSGMKPSRDTAWKITKGKTAPATKDYEFYSTHDTVWVDASGRYVDLSSDTLNLEEWRAFFKQLAKQRSPKAFQGLLVMVSMVEHTPGRFGILTANAQALERQALLLRNFIDELMALFGSRFPVYLIVTKCDLVSGFIEFFDDLGEAECQQVWGSTFASTLSQPGAGLESFGQECEQLQHVLKMRRSSKLLDAETTEGKREIYNFPLQWWECQRRLASFVAALFQHDPDHEPVFWRGFYFISSVQEGLTIDGVGRSINDYLGLPAENPKPVRSEQKSFFLKNLFTQLILADRYLMQPHPAVDRRQQMRQWVGVAAAILLAGILISGFSISYYGNKRLLQAAQQAAERAAPLAQKNMPRDLFALDSLRVLVKSLEKQKPFALRWGLYQGERIVQPTRKIYFASLLRALVHPVQASLEQRLNQPFFCAGNRDSCYLLLKTYLMLDTSRCQLDESLLRRKMFEISQELYRRPLPSGDASALARQIDFYVAHFKDPNHPALRLNENLVQMARRQLQGVATVEMVYTNAKAAAEQAPLMAIALETIFQNQEQDLMAGDYSVPGLFTKPGWERLRAELEKFSSTEQQRDCVLGLATGPLASRSDRAKMQTQIENLYFKEYHEHWRRFIQGISLRRFRNLKDAAQSLNVLTGQSSPLMTLVKIIAEHTDLKQELTQAQFAENPSPFEATPPLVQVKQDFQPIQRLLLVQDGTVTPPPITPYFDALAELGDAMQEISAAPEGGATAFAQELLSGKNNALSRGMENIGRILGHRDSLLRPLCEQPFKYSWAVILVAAQAHLNKLWANAVYTPFVETLATKYPFDPQGREDASRTEAGDFFKPINGTFWSFFDKHLAGFVDHQSGRTKSQPGFEGIRLSDDFREGLAQADFLSKNLVAAERQTQPIFLRLQPEPPQNAPNIDAIELYYDGKAYQYKMGQRPIWTLTWPVANQKVQIIAKTQNRILAIKVFAGHWALFRMLRAARMEQHTLYWNFEGMKTNIGFTVVEMSPTLLPMIKNLQSFHCPGKLD